MGETRRNRSFAAPEASGKAKVIGLAATVFIVVCLVAAFVVPSTRWSSIPPCSSTASALHRFCGFFLNFPPLKTFNSVT
jgi:hypothetical protein